MNREIKFRGKRIESGDWVYGSLIIHPKNHCYISFYDENMLNIVAKVDPETVGQYAVLTDFNEKEIYVGDIVTHEEYRFDCDDNSLESIKKIKGVVSGMDAGHIWIEPTNKNNDPVMLCEADNITIIGNIHDNPELLEARL